MQIFRRRIPDCELKKTIYIVALLLPISFFIINLPSVLSGKLIPNNQILVTQNINDVESAAKWLNQRTTPHDLVIANANISWLLNAKTADLLMATAWAGYSTMFVGNTFTHDRFAYPAPIESARYVVIGDIDTRWALLQPNVNTVFQQALAKGLKPVWHRGLYTIYAWNSAEQPSAHP